ncbi:glycosyltransferase [Pseudomonas gingeri]|uniref:glycosyltransferase n=1 Tax=Pseudomonas gingeri TaxID=117681 RepID=UPI0015A3840D|nr:glycosyltransferase [Pseudomonas gingeri]NWD06438.1 glycosyltransferase [Pseudomonas gingeri]NWE32980.1 glycosyltransferase [Pseudomonas gingeri]NWE55682.1 glycosyltransferase [Pseudomonas gingeri]NWF03829.1 glycosyltransferase [Pseudomonas gingeri]
MHKAHFGENRRQVLSWLTDHWLEDGPVVCFVEGFPGVGKSELSAELAMHVEQLEGWQVIIEEVVERAGALQGTLSDIAERLTTLGVETMLNTLLSEQPNPAFALEQALRKPVLIVLDEAQRLFKADTGEPQGDLVGILAFLRARPTLRGRLLLVSDRLVERARWSESFPIKTLTALTEEDAIALLDDRLLGSGNLDAVPPERKPELIRSLGCNPRAIESLVATLAYESLDEVIGANPSLWAYQDREVSRDFLQRLERDLLERTMSHLEPLQQRRLRMLSAHRRSFERVCFEVICGGVSKDANDFRNLLITRFLLSQRQGWHSLHPIIREIGLAHLRDCGPDFRQAHSKAADYHIRPYEARAMVMDQKRVASTFAELRYHLHHAGRHEDLNRVVLSTADHLMKTIKSNSKIPAGEELDELISVLTILLEDCLVRPLEYYLARCLNQRNRVGDIELALGHAKLAVGADGPRDAADFVARLEERLGRIDDALLTLNAAIEAYSEGGNPVSLYLHGVKLLRSKGRTEEALDLLRRGMAAIPAEKNVVALYHAHVQLLVEENRSPEAIEFLLEGINLISAEFNSVVLYTQCAELLKKNDQCDRAISLLLDGIKKVPAEFNLVALYQLCAEYLKEDGRQSQAIELVEEGLEKLPVECNRAALYLIGAEFLKDDGRRPEAIALLVESMRILPHEFHQIPIYTQCAYLMRLENRIDEARLLLSNPQMPRHIAESGTIREKSVFNSAIGLDLDYLWGVIELDKGASAIAFLAKCLLAQIEGRWADGAQIAREGRAQWPSSYYLVIQEVFCRLCAGEVNDAHVVLESLERLGDESGHVGTWLRCFIAFRQGNLSLASHLYSLYIGARQLRDFSPTQADLLELWNEPVSYSAAHPANCLTLLPPSLTGMDHVVRRPLNMDACHELTDWITHMKEHGSHATTQPSTSHVPAQQALSRGPSVLVMATEWKSAHGGLSTFNREFCRALAAAGCRVVCAVPDATEAEIGHAREYDIHLLRAPGGPGSQVMSGLLRRLDLPEGFNPQLVVGHGRITGPAADVQATDFFREAKRIHFVHMAPGEIEWFKGKDDAAAQSEERERIELGLSETAALVVAVGPRLSREARNLVAALESPPDVHEMIPGFSCSAMRSPPSGLHCLILGRAEDLELKGLDIGALGLAKLLDRNVRFQSDPELIVRGAPQGTGAALRMQLLNIPGVENLSIRVREYASEGNTIEGDLRRATLLLMPSRREGFGLVAQEALALGVPILVSRQSGIGEFLRHVLGDVESQHYIVEARDDLASASDEWAKRIEGVLRDPQAAFQRAHELARKLASEYSWKHAVGLLLDTIKK